MISILTGDCRDVLRTLPDASVSCCVTSPPYFGLRDYGHEGQMGLEKTPDDYIAGMVAVFREVRRVLRDDGTLWLNIGDSYAPNWSSQRKEGGGGLKENDQRERWTRLPGIAPKNLIGIPWMLAFALRADGWYLRQDIIWSKPNPMPESVTDRCTKAHEYLFLLSKGPRYHFDSVAIKEDSADLVGSTKRYESAFGGKKSRAPVSDVGIGTRTRPQGMREFDGKRNKRSVWTVNIKPYKGAHFATFPAKLIEPCILAGCPVGGVVLDPFGGAGTTGLVSQSLGRNSTLIELNPAYAAMAEARLMPAVDDSDW